jgi:hypothetical protein
VKHLGETIRIIVNKKGNVKKYKGNGISEGGLGLGIWVFL